MLGHICDPEDGVKVQVAGCLEVRFPSGTSQLPPCGGELIAVPWSIAGRGAPRLPDEPGRRQSLQGWDSGPHGEASAALEGVGSFKAPVEQGNDVDVKRGLAHYALPLDIAAKHSAWRSSSSISFARPIATPIAWLIHPGSCRRAKRQRN